MSAYSSFIATCAQDQSVAIQAASVLEALAESFETFRDKRALDALSDVHKAMVEWEELAEGYDPTEGIDFSVTVTTEVTEWYIDFAEPHWLVDLPMSIFHGRLMFEAALASQND